MLTKVELDIWAREAVNLALYECFLATAACRAKEALAANAEANFVKPTEEQWLRWQLQRKLNEDGAI